VSTCGQPGVNLGSTWGQPGVNLGSTWGQPGVTLHRLTFCSLFFARCSPTLRSYASRSRSSASLADASAALVVSSAHPSFSASRLQRRDLKMTTGFENDASYGSFKR